MGTGEIAVDLTIVAVLIVSLGFHEWAHARVATSFGDPTAKGEGRLTLNPVAHIDPVFTLLLPVTTFVIAPAVWGTPPFLFGGARPVPVVPANLKRPVVDMGLIAAAGPAMNLVIAMGLLVADNVLRSQAGVAPDDFTSEVLRYGAVWNLLLVAFNLLPIPPLDGSRIVAVFLPGPIRRPYEAIGGLGIVVVLGVVIFVPEVGNWVLTAAADLYDWADGIARDGLKSVGVSLEK